MRSHHPPAAKKKSLLIWSLLVLIILFFSVRFIHLVKNSLFFNSKERINLVMYGKNTTFYSLGRDNVHYAVPFYEDLQIQIPGGYGFYRIGAVGKLAHLEKKPELIQRTFSLASSTFVDFYFFPKTTEIYYGKTVSDNLPVPGFKELFFMDSNANIVDRIYFFLKFFGARSSSFGDLTNIRSYVKEGDTFFSVDNFNKAYQGYFYNKDYRNEKKNLQIIYSRYEATGRGIGQILEGNGIRVSDIDQNSQVVHGCEIKENMKNHSQTAKAVATFFRCQLTEGPTGIYDILFLLGEREKEWAIQ